MLVDMSLTSPMLWTGRQDGVIVWHLLLARLTIAMMLQQCHQKLCKPPFAPLLAGGVCVAFHGFCSVLVDNCVIIMLR